MDEVTLFPDVSQSGSAFDPTGFDVGTVNPGGFDQSQYAFTANTFGSDTSSFDSSNFGFEQSTTDPATGTYFNFVSDPAPAGDLPVMSSDTSWLGVVIDKLPSYVQTAVKLNAAYQSAGKPTLKANTTTSTANANGTVSTRNPATGMVTNAIMPVGNPFILTDGSVVTNNGDGSYSTILPNGSVRTARYPSASGFQMTPMMWIGAGGLALLLLKGR